MTEIERKMFDAVVGYECDVKVWDDETVGLLFRTDLGDRGRIPLNKLRKLAIIKGIEERQSLDE